MPCRRRRRSVGEAKKSPVQQADAANRGPVGDGKLVHGVSIWYHLCDLHGHVHQVLCRAHAQFEPEETTGTANHRYVAAAYEHPKTNGEFSSVRSIVLKSLLI